MSRDAMCFSHTERPATARCRQCQRPVCDECAKSDANGQFCSFDCAGKFKDFQQMGKPKDLKQRGLISLIATLVILAVVLVGGAYVGAKFLKLGFCVEILKATGLDKILP